MILKETINYLSTLELQALIDMIIEASCYTNELDHLIPYTNDEYTFRDLFTEPLEAVRATFYGDYRYDDDYILINQEGNLDSYEDYQLLNLYKKYYLKDIAQAIINNDIMFEG